MAVDNEGHLIHEGGMVVILGLPKSMERGLPDDEAPFVSNSIGKQAVVDEILNEAQVMVMLTDNETGIIHFLSLPSTMVKIVPVP